MEINQNTANFRPVTVGTTEKMDLVITLKKGKLSGGEPEIKINSPIRSLFWEAQNNTVASVLKDYKELDGLEIVIDDNQSLDFVIRARLKAALELYCKQEDKP